MRDFGEVLVWLRERPHPCAPPIGVGAFDVLYASAREIVVWYSPARDGHRAGEVTIPSARLAAAWDALQSGTHLDEAALTQLGAGIAGGRWLLAVLAQLPGVHVQSDPLTLTWAPEPAPLPPAVETPTTVLPPSRTHSGRRRARGIGTSDNTPIIEPRSAAPAARRAQRRRT
ncbi:MAG TPA: hypothetical protein VIC85_08665 [Ktedonobacterales bacterium]|jgi:hypothetical protein